MSRVHSFFLFIAYLFLVQGCGESENNQPDQPISEVPVNGDWVRIHLNSEPDNLNPYLTTISTATFIKEFMYQYMMNLNPENREQIPQLALALPEMSEDGLTFSYEIHPQARWDNGDPITAEDYIFSMKIMFNRNLPLAYMATQYDFIKDVEPDPTNPKKFKVTTKEPNFRSEFSVSGFEIISHKFYDPDGLMAGFSIQEIKENESLKDDPKMKEFAERFQDEKYGRDPAFVYASGPYKLESWDPGVSITLVRKKDYWAADLADSYWCHANYPEKLIFRIINDQEAASLALKNMELDVMKDIPSEKFKEYQEPGNIISENYNLFTPQTDAYTYIGLNTKPPGDRNPVFTDKMVRRALAHLVDVDYIIDEIYLGFGERCIGPINPTAKEANKNLKPIAFDPAKAKELLSAAGWEDTDQDGIRDKVINGKKVKFEAEFMVPKGSVSGVKLANLVADMAKEAGLQINVAEIPSGTLSERLYAHEFDMVGSGFSLPPLLPDFRQVYHSTQWEEHGSNFFGFGNAESDSLIDAIRTTLSAEQRKPMYDRLQEILYDEQPMIFLRNPLEKIAVSKRFKNVVVTSVRPGITPNNWWVPLTEQKFPNPAP